MGSFGADPALEFAEVEDERLQEAEEHEELREQELRQRPQGGEMPVKLRLEADDSPDLPVSFLGKGLGCRGPAKEELLNEYITIWKWSHFQGLVDRCINADVCG